MRLSSLWPSPAHSPGILAGSLPVTSWRTCGRRGRAGQRSGAWETSRPGTRRVAPGSGAAATGLAAVHLRAAGGDLGPVRLLLGAGRLGDPAVVALLAVQGLPHLGLQVLVHGALVVGGHLFLQCTDADGLTGSTL